MNLLKLRNESVATKARRVFTGAVLALVLLVTTRANAQDIVIVRGADNLGVDFTLVNGKAWIATNQTGQVGGTYTNGVDIPEGETWVPVESQASNLNGNLVFIAEKYSTSTSVVSVPWYLAGPGQLYVPKPKSGTGPSIIAFKRTFTKGPYSPDKSVVIPAGSGANISLEQSYDLVNWQPSALGSYAAPTNNLFFRLKMDRTPQ